MAPPSRNLLMVAIPLWMSFGEVASLTEPETCYVLDGILFLYGFILTALYCRMKLYNAREAAGSKTQNKQNVEEGLYMGLTPRSEDVYESIKTKK